jgi:hypothetical protein
MLAQGLLLRLPRNAAKKDITLVGERQHTYYSLLNHPQAISRHLCKASVLAWDVALPTKHSKLVICTMPCAGVSCSFHNAEENTPGWRATAHLLLIA